MLCTACYLMFKHTRCIERTYIGQCRLNAWARWAVAQRPPRAQGPYANLGMLCMACYLMFKNGVCWKYQYNRYMFNFIDHIHFYSCEWFCNYGTQCTVFPGAYNAVKTVLILVHNSSNFNFEDPVRASSFVNICASNICARMSSTVLIAGDIHDDQPFSNLLGQCIYAMYCLALFLSQQNILDQFCRPSFSYNTINPFFHPTHVPSSL